MTSDQSSAIVRANQSDPSGLMWGHIWGMGWAIMGPRVPDGGRSFFGDLFSPQSFGHAGATGTVVWADPVREVVCILFTNEPSVARSGLLGRCSNLVASAAL